MFPKHYFYPAITIFDESHNVLQLLSSPQEYLPSGLKTPIGIFIHIKLREAPLADLKTSPLFTESWEL